MIELILIAAPVTGGLSFYLGSLFAARRFRKIFEIMERSEQPPDCSYPSIESARWSGYVNGLRAAAKRCGSKKYLSVR